MPTRPEARASGPVVGSCWPCGLKSHFSVFFCRYLSVKSLPEALRMEEEEVEGQDCTLGFDRPDPAPGKAVAPRLLTRQPPAQAERSHGVPLE